jgi:hypothetical protein
VEDTRPGGHFSENQLELYAFNRLTEPEAAQLEEHLLICGSCQTRLTAVDNYIEVMKAAAVLPNKKPPERARALLLTSPIWVGGLALIAALAIYSPPRPLSLAKEVELRSDRGGPSLMSHAPAGARLSLSIDATSLPKLPSYRLEVVNAQGGQVWQASVVCEERRIRTPLGANLKPGTYWVRLFGPALLREYGLELN